MNDKIKNVIDKILLFGASICHDIKNILTKHSRMLGFNKITYLVCKVFMDRVTSWRCHKRFILSSKNVRTFIPVILKILFGMSYIAISLYLVWKKYAGHMSWRWSHQYIFFVMVIHSSMFLSCFGYIKRRTVQRFKLV